MTNYMIERNAARTLATEFPLTLVCYHGSHDATNTPLTSGPVDGETEIPGEGLEDLETLVEPQSNLAVPSGVETDG